MAYRFTAREKITNYLVVCWIFCNFIADYKYLLLY